MDGGLYERDWYTWTQVQSAALRRLAATHVNLPEELDLSNLAEEVEDMGTHVVNGVRSHLRLMMAHLIYIAVQPTDGSVRHWLAEVSTFQSNALDGYLPSMRRVVEPMLDKAWRTAKRTAVNKLGRLPSLPEECPYTLDDLLDEDADLRALAARLAPAEARSDG